MFRQCLGLPSESTADELQRSVDCIKALLEASADVTVEYSEDGIMVGDDFSELHGYSLVNYSPKRMLHADYLQAAFKLVLDLGSPFISIASPCIDLTGKSTPALAILAESCGLAEGDSFNILGKTILLLNRGANVLCRDYFGNTVLHLVISSGRLSKSRTGYGSARWFISLTQPFNLLVLFMTAGADVYATNDAGETPSMVAMEFGRIDEWTSALKMCGFDVEEVLNHPSPCCKDCIPNHQTPQLSFETWCEQLGDPDHDSFRHPDGSWDDGDTDSDEGRDEWSEDGDEVSDEWDGGSHEGSNSS
jgi:hypothetical protein